MRVNLDRTAGGRESVGMGVVQVRSLTDQQPAGRAGDDGVDGLGDKLNPHSDASRLSGSTRLYGTGKAFAALVRSGCKNTFRFRAERVSSSPFTTVHGHPTLRLALPRAARTEAVTTRRRLSFLQLWTDGLRAGAY